MTSPIQLRWRFSNQSVTDDEEPLKTNVHPHSIPYQVCYKSATYSSGVPIKQFLDAEEVTNNI